MIKQIDHIGIAVRNIEEQKDYYTKILGLKAGKIEVVLEQKVKTILFPAGEVRIELLEATAEDSPIAKFIEKRGEGIHHIAYRVDNIQGHLDDMKEKNIRLIDYKPKPGSKGLLIAFLHPKSTYGVLTELCQVVK